MLATAFVALLSLAASADATYSSSYAYASIGGRYSFGCSTTLKQQATTSQKEQCSSAGSFFTSYKDSPLCCSDKTRTTPESDVTCPFDWGMHKTAKCCIPETEVSTCDCGEGYTYNDNSKKCEKDSGSCGGGQWYHARSGECCDDSWESSPPSGDCPSGVSCPSDWFWHSSKEKCVPLKPRSPEPDCDDWNESNQCCGGHTSPSQGSGHHGGGHGGGGHKRDLKEREQFTLFPQSNLDKMYCPDSLHACTVATSAGGEWAYECIDPATELESCGGCASTGEGVDCTQIPHAMAVGCEVGVCAVYTCKSGFSANGTACVAL